MRNGSTVPDATNLTDLHGANDERLTDLRVMAELNDEPILAWAADRIAELDEERRRLHWRVFRLPGRLQLVVAWRTWVGLGRVGGDAGRARRH